MKTKIDKLLDWLCAHGVHISNAHYKGSMFWVLKVCNRCGTILEKDEYEYKEE